MKRIFTTAIIAVLLIQGAFAQSKGKIEVPIRFDRYYDYHEMIEAMKVLHKAYPELTTLDMVGHSEENREIWALTINNKSTGDALSKPGVYVDGNIHGNEVQAGEVCLYYANLLLTRYHDNEKIRKVVDRNAHYIIPVVNVDGRAHFFEDANTPSTNRSIRVPVDDDRDGLFDEDGPDDLDGDGNICTMRIRDPFGNMKTDPEDPRLMIPVKPGEKGEWTLLGYEGIDNDGDGRYNEDAEGSIDPNRNWGANWQPPYVQSGAGNFPLSGKGLLAIAQYIHERPNIIVNFAFHNTGGMWLRVPATREEQIAPSDIAVYDVLGTNAIKMTPGYVYHSSLELYPTYGDTDSHMFYLEGSYALVGELFMRSQETYRENVNKPVAASGETPGGGFRWGPTPEESREQLKFNDHLALTELYKDWKPFTHPVYGEIEIGGWVKMSSRIPHPFMLPELAHRNAMVVLFAAEQTPDISMEVFEVTPLGKNLHRVRVRLSNANAIPSMSAMAESTRLYQRDMLKISGVKVVAAGKINDRRNNLVTYQQHKPELVFTTVPGYGFVEHEFLIEGKGTMHIDYSSRKAKNLTTTIKL